MRTTVVLDDGLLRQARRRAAERDLTLSDIVNEALRESLRSTPPDVPPFAMVTYGRPDRRVRHGPSDFALDLEEEDRARIG
jgi:hypothetical protein